VISVQEVVLDTDLTAPEPYQVKRTTGQFALGGFQPLQVTTFLLFGPVQQASNKEINMLQEADRVGSIRSFWSTVPIYLTRGTAPVPSVQGSQPSGAVPGTVYILPQAPQGGAGDFYINGRLQRPGVDYVLSGSTLTTTNVTPSGAQLWFQYPVTVQVQDAYSDIILYPPGGDQFRVLQRYRDDGSGYWKAVATRMNAA